MLITETSFGIDFKQNHLTLTLLKKSFGKIRLVDFVTYPVPADLPKEEQETQMVGMINGFVSKHRIDKERVFVSIPREKAGARFLQLPAAVQENLKKVMEYEIPKYTPFESAEVYFDFQVLKQEKDRLYLFAVYVKKTELDHYLALLKKADIHPVSIQISSVSALNLFSLHQEPRESGVSVLFDLDESSFEINILRDKRDWKDNFYFSLPFNEKETKWISTLNQSGLGSDAFAKAYGYAYGPSANERTVGGIKRSGPLKDILAPPSHRISIGNKSLKTYSIYPSLGLPLRGLTRTWLNLNLLPPEMRKKMRQSDKLISLILLGITLLLLLSLGVGTFFQYRWELNRLTTEMKRKKPDVEKIEKMQNQKTVLFSEILELNKIKAGEISKAEILNELTQLLPDSVWIWSLKYKGKEIEISGYADSASSLIPLLDRSPLFEKVEFLAPVTKEKLIRPEGEKEKERFKIKARLESRGTGA